MNPVHEATTCAVAACAEIIGSKWTALLVHDMSEGPRRFSELEHSCLGISPRTLAERLRALEQEGILVRRSYPERPPRVRRDLEGHGVVATDRENGGNRRLFPSYHTGKYVRMRTPSSKTQSVPLATVITATLKLWRKHHLSYDQTRYVAKEVRRALAIARPSTRPRGIVRLSRADEARLIAQAYRMPGVRGLLIKTLFQTGARVSEFVHLQVADVYFDEQMLLITHAKGGK